MNCWSHMSRRRGAQSWLQHRHVGYDLEPDCVAYNEDIYWTDLIFEAAYAIAVLFLELLSSKFYLCDKYPLIAIMGQIVLTPAWKTCVWRFICGHRGGDGVLSCISSQLLLNKILFEFINEHMGLMQEFIPVWIMRNSESLNHILHPYPQATFEQFRWSWLVNLTRQNDIATKLGIVGRNTNVDHSTVHLAWHMLVDMNWSTCRDTYTWGWWHAMSVHK